MLAVPGRARFQLPHLTAHDAEVLAEIVRGQLEAAALAPPAPRGLPWSASPSWLFKEARQAIRHGWNKQAAIQEQVPHFAACFSNKEASMAGRAVVARSPLLSSGS